MCYNPAMPREKPTKQPRYTVHEGVTEPNTVVLKDVSYIISTDAADEVQVEEAKSILIEDGIITDIVQAGKETPWLDKADAVYDAGLRAGTIVTPGFVNCHSHPPMYLLRSSTLLAHHYATTEESLVVARKIERAMDVDDQRVAAIGDFSEQQKFGTTTVVSHYHTPQATRPAARAAGMRVVDCISVASKTDPSANMEKAQATFADVDGLVSAGITIHTMERVDAAQLAEVKQVMEANPEILLTIHCGETLTEVEGSLQKHGKRPIAVLHEAGLLSHRLLLSHAVHFTEEEIKLLVEHQVGVVHLPTSNRIHKSGEFNYVAFQKYGGADLVSLGTDSVISKNELDIVSEAFQSKIMHQDTEHPPSYPELFKMMTSNGAKVIGKESEIGRVAVGYKADLALWKLKSRPFIPYDETHLETLIGNFISHSGSMVRDLMVDGRFVISRRRHQKVNESELLRDIQDRHRDLLGRI